MKSKHLLLWAFSITIFSVATLIFGIISCNYDDNLNQKIFAILDEYNTEYPMPEAEITELNLYLSKTGINPVVQAQISYIGLLKSGMDISSYDTPAYTYNISEDFTSTLTIQEAPWSVTLSQKYDGGDIRLFFQILALIILLCSIPIWIAYYILRKKTYIQKK